LSTAIGHELVDPKIWGKPVLELNKVRMVRVKIGGYILM
jgi:hypothetical protein